MSELKIRRFTHNDVEDFIRVAETAFANEWLNNGMTPDGFARQTRKIFRWKMIPFRLLAALTGVQWEAFVAEVDGKLVGGGLYAGQKKRMSLSYLMVEPAYRRRGIGQALLVKRLERLSEKGIPFVTVEVLETNQASLGNLRKQGFVEYNRQSIYKCSLPFSGEKPQSAAAARPVRPSDKVLFRETIEKTTPPFVLQNRRFETAYFRSFWGRLYDRYTGSSEWVRAFDAEGTTVGFLAAYKSDPMIRGFIGQPILTPENVHYLPTMLHQAGVWMAGVGIQSSKISVPDYRDEIKASLLETGWKKLYTWISLVKWLDEKARQEFESGTRDA